MTVKNEAAYLLDWLAHHRAAGFNRFLIFSNDCSDGTDAMLDRLQDLGWVRHMPNPGPYHARGVQFTALRAAQSHPMLEEADWILPLDIDEFVTIKTGDHSLSALFDALPGATAITLTWRLFGNGGAQKFCDRPVPERFIRCAPERIFWPWRAVMFKTLYRNNGIYGAPGVHRPRNPRDARIKDARWFDTMGRALPEHFRTQRIFSDYGIPHYGLAQLNHYPLGDMQSFVLKADRGRAVHGDDRIGIDYWVERNFNQEEDRSISALAGQTAALRDELRRDPVLTQLHADAVRWRHEAFARLLQNEQSRALYGRLLMSAPSRLVPEAEARFMIRQAQAAGETADGPA
jgi:hypothetical protein